MALCPEQPSESHPPCEPGSAIASTTAISFPAEVADSSTQLVNDRGCQNLIPAIVGSLFSGFRYTPGIVREHGPISSTFRTARRSIKGNR